jgi:[glutamine synthetase] adenylyltransferase / [glutamine synthetase]-adenylyl-L-tyrosine phosphorylase
MRARIFREHGTDQPWNLKHVRGGLVELEFLAQFLQLRFAPGHPDLLTPGTLETFMRAAREGLLEPDDAAALVEAARLYHRLQAVLRLSVQEGAFDPGRAPAGLRQAMIRAAYRDAAPHPAPEHDFAELEGLLAETQARVRRIFEALCPEAADAGGETSRGDPASSAKPSRDRNSPIDKEGAR